MEWEHMEKHDTESTPMKAVLEELDNLRSTVHETMQRYQTRLETEIDGVRSKVESVQEKKRLSHAKMHDLRDMLTVLRTTRVEKGRRKDLKKLDGVVDDLRMLTEDW